MPAVYSLLPALLFLGLNACGASDPGGQVPEIVSIDTAKGGALGPVTGGTRVTIHGRNFAQDAVVTFGNQFGTDVSAPNFETLLVTTQPVFRSGPVPLTVTALGQITEQSDAFIFTPVIVFSSDRDGDSDLYLMEIDGSGVRPLTINTLRDNTDPTSLISDERPRFSSDGQSIVFESNRTGDFDIYTIDRNGQQPTNLTLNPTATDQQAAFSPDGQDMVFISNRDGDSEIYLMDRTGANLRQLTQNTSDDRGPRFSPDGSQIVFTSNRDGDFEIFLMNKDGSNVLQLTQNGASDLEPSFSPDGNQTVFSSNLNGNFDLYVMDKDGSNLNRLTTNGAKESNPSFLSPSAVGKKVLFSSTRSGNEDVFVMQCSGAGSKITSCDESTATNLSRHASADFHPAPSP